MIEPLENRIAPAALVSAVQVASGGSGVGSSVVGVDSAGDTVVAGPFFGTIDLTPRAPAGTAHTVLTTTDGSGDLYIAKYAPDGTLLWANTWGGTGQEEANGIAFDAAGDVYVTGGFSSATTGTGAGFGGSGTLRSQGNEDIFILKLNAADGSPAAAFNGGEVQWGGADDPGFGTTEAGLSIAVDSTGAVVVAGLFSSHNAGFLNSSQTISTTGGADAVVLKLDGTTAQPVNSFGASGAVSMGGVGNEAFTRVVIDGNDDLFLAFQSTTGGQSESIVKLSGATGSPDSAFGTFGTVTIAPAGTAGTTDPNLPFDIALDGALGVYGIVGTGTKMSLSRFDPNTGALDPTFGTNGTATLNYNPESPVQINIDSQHDVVVTSNLNGKLAISSVNENGVVQFDILSSGMNLTDAALNSTDQLVLRGTYSTNIDLDPTHTVLKLPPQSIAVIGDSMSEGAIVTVDLFAFNAGNPLGFTDGNGNNVTATLAGPGLVHYSLDGGPALDTLTLMGTDLTSKLTISSHFSLQPFLILEPQLVVSAQVAHILTQGANQSIGSITLSGDIVLGDGAVEATPALHISGEVKSLSIAAIAPNALIKLGDGLPYNAPGNLTPDTYNNHPNLTIGDVQGAGVEIDLTGDGTPGGVGGGGLGNVVIHSWDFTGLIQTTQSVGNFTIQTGDFLGNLLLDPNHLGEFTTANIGNMTVANGSWGGSGTEIEGNIQSFDATAFLAGASITAASIGSVKTTDGGFDGTLTLTGANAAKQPTFNVDSDFAGTVISSLPLKKINIKGDFTGSLQAPGIAAITAYAFLGMAPANPGDPNPDFINTTGGFFGAVKSISGIVQYYDLITSEAFAGITVNGTKLTQDTAGINYVNITAASIGNISVNLSAGKTAAGLNLIGISNSTFTTMDTGTTKGAIGSIGNVSVKITGNAGVASATGIANTTFDAQVLANEFGTNPASTVNPLGNLSVKLTGTGGVSEGLDTDLFEANTIGKTAVNVSPGKTPGATALALDTVSYTADHAIGAISIGGNATSASVTALDVWAGGALGTVSIKSTTAANGSLINSQLLAGQALAIAGITSTKQLAAGALGAVTISGSLTGSTIAAGSNLGAVSVGGTVDSSYLLAGSLLGSDHALGGGDDSFQRAAAIAAVTVKGAFTTSSIAAGIDPVAGGFGDADDALGQAAGTLTLSSQIGPVSLGGGVLLSDPANPHQYAIEAAAIKKLTLHGVPSVTDFTTPVLIDVAGDGEDPTDILVRLLS